MRPFIRPASLGDLFVWWLLGCYARYQAVTRLYQAEWRKRGFFRSP